MAGSLPSTRPRICLRLALKLLKLPKAKQHLPPPINEAIQESSQRFEDLHPVTDIISCYCSPIARQVLVMQFDERARGLSEVSSLFLFLQIDEFFNLACSIC